MSCSVGQQVREKSESQAHYQVQVNCCKNSTFKFYNFMQDSNSLGSLIKNRGWKVSQKFRKETK